MVSPSERWLLSGGIGSGKSEVRKLLETKGIRTVDADAVGHAVLRGEGFDPVAARWPEVVFEGEIDRKALAGIVFADSLQLAELEAITHPLIFGRIDSELERFSEPAVVEIPLIHARPGWRRMIVDARNEIRLARALSRGMDEEDVRRRMLIQPSRAEWLATADLVVPNHADLAGLESAVDMVVTYVQGR